MIRLDVALWRAMPVRGPGRIVVANLRRRTRRAQVTATGPHAIRLLVDPRNPPEVSVYLWATYEPEVVLALERVVLPGVTAVDVGANCGVLSVLMRRLTGPRGRVVAVDPSPAACRRLHEQAAANDMRDMHILQAGLGASPHQDSFRAGRVGIGVLPRVDAQLTTREHIAVEVMTLDAAIADLEVPPVAVIKIDTDGSELDVLAGARAVMTRDRPVLIFEVFGDGLRRRGAEPAALADLLDRCQYDLFAARTQASPRWRAAPPRTLGFRRAPLSALTTGTIDHQNVVAISRLDDGARAREALLSDAHKAAR